MWLPRGGQVIVAASMYNNATMLYIASRCRNNLLTCCASSVKPIEGQALEVIRPTSSATQVEQPSGRPWRRRAPHVRNRERR